MKRTLLALAALLTLSTGAFAQSSPEIDLAVLAAPENLRAGAMVIKWNPADWTYTTLRPGTNKMVCFDKSGLPGQLPFSLECTSVGNLPRATQNMRFEAMGRGPAKQAALDAAEKDGTRAKPEFGSVWYHLMGQSKDAARKHMTIAVPMATEKTLGLPENGQQGGVWIMDGGTSTAHLMVPGE